jgi:hypothetical protein
LWSLQRQYLRRATEFRGSLFTLAVRVHQRKEMTREFHATLLPVFGLRRWKFKLRRLYVKKTTGLAYNKTECLLWYQVEPLADVVEHFLLIYETRF